MPEENLKQPFAVIVTQQEASVPAGTEAPKEPVRVDAKPNESGSEIPEEWLHELMFDAPGG